MDERAPTLLVIEDAQDQAILVGVAARRALPGLVVHNAEDGQQGIDYLAGVAPLRDPPDRTTPDLVILDLVMPVVDGFGVLQWIGENFGTAPFPVVVLTGALDPEREARALALGAAEVYRKPEDVAQLGAAVRRIVTRWIDPGAMLAAHMGWAG